MELSTEKLALDLKTVVCCYCLFPSFFILVKSLKAAVIPGKKCPKHSENPTSSGWHILVIPLANPNSSASKSLYST